MASALGSLAAGFLAGLAIAASPGPIFFLVVGRILERGRRSGFASGAGVATADGIYALVAALGIGVASAVLAGSGRWLAAAGGVALIALGLRSVLTRPANTTPASASAAGLVADYASTLALTIGNPQTIIAFLAVFAGARAGMGLRGGLQGWVVAGVLAGSAAWWLLLTVVVGTLRTRLGPRWVRGLRVGSGVAITTFGLAALAAALRS
jgi:threonine/homoserine/homoserine lactone efflux protein